VTVVDCGRTLADLQNDAEPLEPGPHDEIQYEVISPLPQVELPGVQYTADHADARDVTPPPRPPMPPPSPPPAPRDEPLTYSNAGIPRREHERELTRLNNFLDGDWGDPKDHPLRYPPGNRNGW
jgi:hypothetical protein